LGSRRDAHNFAGAHPAVISHSVDIDRVGIRGGVNFKGDGLALVDADIGGETLNR
jgi:hypothetical protein